MKYFTILLCAVLCICFLETTQAKLNPVCSVCKLAMRKLDQRLAGDRTRGRVVNEVHSVCNHIPHVVSGRCNNFVNEHGEQIIDLIVDKGVPLAVCTALRVCL
ncbi:saposin-C-like [Calliopsis andreniformis]|uniref:saposin-C-like n=1 Tax=Calliopsis andreniformis TaxID=337506 RepID=UPI003FCCD445